MSNPMKTFCEVCGLELTDAVSIARKMGPECAMNQSRQFSAISSLTLALTTGWYDQIAQRNLIFKRTAEARLNQAKEEGNTAKIAKFTKELRKLNGILVSRELYRQSRIQQPLRQAA